MNKKTLVQYTLFFIIILILITFFNVYIFKEEKIVEKENLKKEIQSDIIQDLRYLSKDAYGNTYLVTAEKGFSNED